MGKIKETLYYEKLRVKIFQYSQKTYFFLTLTWPSMIGTVNSGDFSGFLSSNKNGYSLEIAKIKKTSEFLPNLPEQTLAAISVQPKSEIDFSAVFSRFNNFIGPLNRSTKLLDQETREGGGIFVLTKNDFLLEMNLDELTLSQILETAASFRNLAEKPMILPDGSSATELTIDQSAVNFTSFWSNGREIKSAGGFFAVEDKENDIISSNRALLEDYLNNKGKQSKHLAYLEPKNIRNAFWGQEESVEKPKLFDFAFCFSQILLKQSEIEFLY